jgi:hemerythrin-like metal-binding protein
MTADPAESRMEALKEMLWDESYAIGIEEIDRQHMEFMRLLRRFNLGLQKDAPASVQLRILDELLKYADYHFSSEENIMFFTKYPEFETQQREHSRLRNGLVSRVDAYRRTPATGEQLSQFLYEWFVNHIQVEDRKIAAHFQAGKTQLSGRQP